MKPVLAKRGQSVQRVEDQRLLRGQGRFVDTSSGKTIDMGR